MKGLEDVYLQFTEIGGSGVTLVLGQFQISDPLFKREIRLEYEDYQLYRVCVGEALADLTHDRGIMASISPWKGGDLVIEILNGTGRLSVGDSRHYDHDDWKNYVVCYSQELGALRVGGFGLFGMEEQNGVRDHIRVWGPDLTLSLGRRLELNFQYLSRTDDRPFFDAVDGARNTAAFLPADARSGELPRLSNDATRGDGQIWPGNDTEVAPPAALFRFLCPEPSIPLTPRRRSCATRQRSRPAGDAAGGPP